MSEHLDEGFEITETTPLYPIEWGEPGSFDFGSREYLSPSNIEQEQVEEDIARMNGLARAVFLSIEIVCGVVLFGLACAAYFEVRS